MVFANDLHDVVNNAVFAQHAAQHAALGLAAEGRQAVLSSLLCHALSYSAVWLEAI